MTRRETIVELARTLRDVQPAAVRNTSSRSGGHADILELSTLYRAGSYHELEQALAFMHSHAKQYAIAGNSLGKLHWHFTHRYLNAERKAMPARMRGDTLQVCWDGQWQQPALRWMPYGGLFRFDAGGVFYVQVETWHHDVRPERVDLAVNWLDTYMPKGLHLPDWERLSEPPEKRRQRLSDRAA